MGELQFLGPTRGSLKLVSTTS